MTIRQVPLYATDQEPVKHSIYNNRKGRGMEKKKKTNSQNQINSLHNKTLYFSNGENLP